MTSCNTLYDNEEEARASLLISNSPQRNYDFNQAVFHCKKFVGFVRGTNIDELIEAKKKIKEQTPWNIFKGKIIKRSYGNIKRTE